MNRQMTSVLTSDVEASATFYESLLGMKRHGDFGWFVILTHESLPGLEFGILEKTHESVPKALALAPGGVLLTFVVADVEVCFAKAQQLGCTIVAPPTDTPYGQKRLLVSGPSGEMIDISSPTS